MHVSYTYKHVYSLAFIVFCYNTHILLYNIIRATVQCALTDFLRKYDKNCDNIIRIERIVAMTVGFVFLLFF